MSKQIALTFDDGPNTTTTVEVLNILKKYNVVASFFLIADLITPESVESVKEEVKMGCEIANHTKSHQDMTKMDPDTIREEIDYCSKKIYEITGEYPKFFRPPFILVNETMVENIDLPFICGINGLDWDPTVMADERARLVLETAEDGSIILLHDLEGNVETVKALDVIIPKLLEEGYEFVTISDVFKNKGITPPVHSGIVYSNALQTKRYDEENK